MNTTLLSAHLLFSLAVSPFDKDDQASVASSVNKAPSVSKRFSTIFNQSPPDTPSLREQAFYVSYFFCYSSTVSLEWKESEMFGRMFTCWKSLHLYFYEYSFKKKYVDVDA